MWKNEDSMWESSYLRWWDGVWLPDDSHQQTAPVQMKEGHQCWLEGGSGGGSGEGAQFPSILPNHPPPSPRTPKEWDSICVWRKYSAKNRKINSKKREMEKNLYPLYFISHSVSRGWPWPREGSSAPSTGCAGNYNWYFDHLNLCYTKENEIVNWKSVGKWTS